MPRADGMKFCLLDPLTEQWLGRGATLVPVLAHKLLPCVEEQTSTPTTSWHPAPKGHLLRRGEGGLNDATALNNGVAGIRNISQRGPQAAEEKGRQDS